MMHLSLIFSRQTSLFCEHIVMMKSWSHPNQKNKVERIYHAPTQSMKKNLKRQIAVVGLKDCQIFPHHFKNSTQF